jgi:uncharacterized protein (UPF0332 family)
MYLISVKECFRKRLLRKIPPSKGLAKKSLKQARSFLRETDDLLNLEKERMAVIALYNAFFHAARALLFKDGIKEKSHFCIARYLEEYYVKKKLLDIKFLNYLETLRDLRHETQYSVEEVEIEQDLNKIYITCIDFVVAVEKLV